MGEAVGVGADNMDGARTDALCDTAGVGCGWGCGASVGGLGGAGGTGGAGTSLSSITTAMVVGSGNAAGSDRVRHNQTAPPACAASTKPHTRPSWPALRSGRESRLSARDTWEERRKEAVMGASLAHVIDNHSQLMAFTSAYPIPSPEGHGLPVARGIIPAEPAASDAARHERFRDVMDVSLLLSPIAAHSPCGEDMSFSKEFDQIAEMRRADDPSLDQGAWVTALKQADWPGVARQCTTLLRTRTKDLRLALWLTEARALSEGQRGMAEGLDVCTALCEQHWPDLHPRPEAGDMEERVGNIAWLLQRLVDIAPTLPVTRGPGPQDKDERLSLRDLAHARLQDARAGDATHEARFRHALAHTPPAQLRDTLTAQQAAEAALRRWQAVVDTHLGQEGPSFVAAREALAQVTHGLTRLLRDVGVAPLSEDDAAPTHAAANQDTRDAADLANAQVATAALPAGIPSSGDPLRPPQTRADALRQLRDVAAFFRRTEPHSPVAYLAEKAVKWGDMPLHEWLQEVVKDSGAMAHLQELLGLGEGKGADTTSGSHAAP